jgi:Mn2+/Fe2+ NRAMP family transporter
MTATSQVQDYDPYVLSEATIKEPPTRWLERFRYLGPGIILSASIVGSGELIATTTLGARAGFVTLWVILVSCVIKVALQLEFGRHAINTGESTMASFNRLPGPKLGRAKWPIWTWLLIMILKFIQVGGIVGGVALALNIAFPGVGVSIWTWITAISVALLVFKGYYQPIEKISLVMMCMFTLLTVACVAFLQFTEYAVSWANIFEGMRFGLPKAAVGVAIAAFGITGVGGDEIMYYNYWCIEKGYAAYTGPKKDTPDWVRRAKGWIKVMYVDALVAMVIYTIATVAFYLLGSAVLHGRGEIPKGFAMVEILSRMYTETLGPWAKVVFLVGAFVVLYSTLFAGLASWTRIFGDAFGQIGLFNFYDRKTRSKAIAILAFIIPTGWALLFLFIRAPVFMVLVGGIGTSIMLMIVIYAAVHYRYWRLSKELTPGRLFDVWFWLSATVIAFVGVYGIVKLLI